MADSEDLYSSFWDFKRQPSFHGDSVDLPATCVRNIVLNASLPGGSMAEATPHGRPEICSFWDAVEEAKRPSATVYA